MQVRLHCILVEGPRKSGWRRQVTFKRGNPILRIDGTVLRVSAFMFGYMEEKHISTIALFFVDRLFSFTNI